MKLSTEIYQLGSEDGFLIVEILKGEKNWIKTSRYSLNFYRWSIYPATHSYLRGTYPVSSDDTGRQTQQEKTR